jgi:TDG/mug DNA glycosylase family protein
MIRSRSTSRQAEGRLDRASGFVTSFPPIAGPDARILILGSMPGAMSLRLGRYYAHPRNAFWGIMGELAGAGPDKPYDERTRILRSRGIAVWDVLKSCIRPGSLDADISVEEPNDFAAFFAAHPRIAHVGLNGGKAAASFRKYGAPHLPPGVAVTQLPSTSPAHAALDFARKCAAWRSALPM